MATTKTTRTLELINKELRSLFLKIIYNTELIMYSEESEELLNNHFFPLVVEKGAKPLNDNKSFILTDSEVVEIIDYLRNGENTLSDIILNHLKRFDLVKFLIESNQKLRELKSNLGTSIVRLRND